MVSVGVYVSGIVMAWCCATVALSVWLSTDAVMRTSLQGYGARWDFIGVVPPTRLLEWVNAIIMSSSDAHELWSELASIAKDEGWSVVFSAIHVLCPLYILASLRGVPSKSWIAVRLLLFVLHIAVLCMCGSVELGLHLGGSVLVPPALLGGSDLDVIMREHYADAGRRSAPARSMFGPQFAAQFVPSVLLSLTVVVLAGVDLFRLEDDFDQQVAVEMLCDRNAPTAAAEKSKRAVRSVVAHHVAANRQSGRRQRTKAL